MEKRTSPCFVNVSKGYSLKISLRSGSDHGDTPAWFSQRQLINMQVHEKKKTTQISNHTCMVKHSCQARTKYLSFGKTETQKIRIIHLNFINACSSWEDHKGSRYGTSPLILFYGWNNCCNKIGPTAIFMAIMDQ